MKEEEKEERGEGGEKGDYITRCFRHQHPEAYDRKEVPEPEVPMEFRYGRDGGMVSGEYVPETDRGREDVRREFPEDFPPVDTVDPA